MKTVTIDVRPLADTLGDFTQTWKSGKATAPRISFESPELLFKVLSGKRWELLNALTGAGAMSIRDRTAQRRNTVENRRWNDRLPLRRHPCGLHA
jgi:predicted transcriptional regulator